jgi:gluconolactonase
VWFTDPPFGLGSLYDGVVTEPELPAAVYRFDPHEGQLDVVTDEVLGPNGLCFSPDESLLYVVESRGIPNRKIRSFAVQDGRRLANNRLVLDAGPGTPDGMRCDAEGNLWCGWGMGTPELDGVRVFNPAGAPIGRIALPERCANVCFGGRQRNRLFMAAGHALYGLYVNVQGAAGG